MIIIPNNNDVRLRSSLLWLSLRLCAVTKQPKVHNDDHKLIVVARKHVFSNWHQPPLQSDNLYAISNLHTTSLILENNVSPVVLHLMWYGRLAIISYLCYRHEEQIANRRGQLVVWVRRVLPDRKERECVGAREMIDSQINEEAPVHLIISFFSFNAVPFLLRLFSYRNNYLSITQSIWQFASTCQLSRSRRLCFPTPPTLLMWSQHCR